ncbi:MAG TPA: outer membrane beta-barrel protein [Bacteroidales bacterium]|nr:outer membrane beta-barrel protein [Bacteroidales bacterium]
MKTRKIIKFSAAVLLINCVFVMNIYGQKSYIKDRWNIKAGYSRYVTGVRINNKEETTGHYRIEGNYGLFNHLETGIYLGYSNHEIMGTELSRENYSVPFYGVSLNIHILPLLIEKKDFRFDLYAAVKYGGRYITTPSNYSIHGHYNEYGIGIGFAFYFLRNAGIFAEYSYGKYHYIEVGDFTIKDKNKLRYGVSFKF